MGVGGAALANQKLLPTCHELIGAGAKVPSQCKGAGFWRTPI